MDRDLEAATDLARSLLDADESSDGIARVFVGAPRLIHDHWVFGYNSRRYVENGDVMAAFAGNGPIAVPVDAAREPFHLRPVPSIASQLKPNAHAPGSRSHRMDALTDLLLDAFEAHFGDAVQGYTVSESRDEPTPWLTVEFVVYGYFPIVLTYDRGRFGFGIAYGSTAVPVSIPPMISRELESPGAIAEAVEAFDAAIRLRIPDKYLESLETRD